MSDWEEKLRVYDALVGKCTRFERKGKTMPYTAANGHMFSMLNKAGEIGIRFSSEVQQKYMLELHSTPYTSYGAVMKGYVLIPRRYGTTGKRMTHLLNESYDYVMTLPPK